MKLGNPQPVPSRVCGSAGMREAKCLMRFPLEEQFRQWPCCHQQLHWTKRDHSLTGSPTQIFKQHWNICSLKFLIRNTSLDKHNIISSLLYCGIWIKLQADIVVSTVPNEDIQDSIFGESITGLVTAHGDLYCRMSSGICWFPFHKGIPWSYRLSSDASRERRLLINSCSVEY